MIFYTNIESALGRLLVTGEEGKLTGLYFADQSHARMGVGWSEQPGADIFLQTDKQLQEYAAGTRKRFDLPVELKGTPAQMRVWAEIATIPFGMTMTYEEIAKCIGSSDGVRAVGGATGRNPVSWIVPCHRVMGKSGAVTGFAGGIARKKALLDFEAAKSTGQTARLEWEAVTPRS